jgi:hypothetical protein
MGRYVWKKIFPANESRLSCAHETLTKAHPHSAKSDLNNNRALGVSLKPLLAGPFTFQKRKTL